MGHGGAGSRKGATRRGARISGADDVDPATVTLRPALGLATLAPDLARDVVRVAALYPHRGAPHT